MSSLGIQSYAAIQAYKDKHSNARPQRIAREDEKDAVQNLEPKTPSPTKRRRSDDSSGFKGVDTPSKKAAHRTHNTTLVQPTIYTPTSIAKLIPLPPSPAQTASPSRVGVSSATPVDLTVDPLTPTPTPNKQKSLESIPKIANRYVPQTSRLTGIDHRNPQEFSLKPGYWKPWSSQEYVIFAANLREQFDPELFAQSSGRTVEEIQHVFASLVVNPLYDAAEASRRGTEGMKEIMEMFNMFSTPIRIWGKRGVDGVKNTSAELDCVTKDNAVKLIDVKGSELVMRVEELSERDKQYLRNQLTDEDKEKLWGLRSTSIEPI